LSVHLDIFSVHFEKIELYRFCARVSNWGVAIPTLPALELLGHGRGKALSGVVLPKGFDLRCGAGKTARVWLQGKGGGLRPGQAFVLLPPKEGEGDSAPAGYVAPLCKALIDKNKRYVNVVVCESDYRALKRGIEHLPPALQ
jgi:hypothetical protein